MDDPFAPPAPAPAPANDPFAGHGDPFAPEPTAPVEDPFAATADPFAPEPAAPQAPSSDPFSGSADPFASSPASPAEPADPYQQPVEDPFAAPTPAQPADMPQPVDDPFAASSPADDPFATTAPEPAQSAPAADPFATPAPANDPFAAPAGDPFAGTPAGGDPFGEEPSSSQSAPADDPFAAPAPQSGDPFAPAPPADDPFAAPAPQAGDPFAPPAPSGDDPFAAPAAPAPAEPAEDPFAAPAPPAQGGGDLWGASDANTWDPAAGELQTPPAEPAPTAGGDVIGDPFAGYDEPSTLPVPASGPLELAAVDLVWAGARAPRRDDEAARDAQDLEDLVTAAQRDAAMDASSRGNRKRGIKFLPFERIRPGDPAIFAFASPKGGSGKSSTALNFAASIAYTGKIQAEKSKRAMDPPKVLLIDGDIGDGSLSVRVIGKPPRHNSHAGAKDPNTGRYEADEIPSLLSLINYIDDKAAEGHRDEPSTFDEPGANALSMRDFVLARDQLPNLHILAAPDEPDFVSDMEADEYRELLKRLGRFYDIIVLDCGTEMWAHYNQVWYESAHAIFVMMSPDLATLNSCRKFIRYITRGRPATKRGPARIAMTSKDKLHLVMLNSNAHNVRINPRDTAKKLFSWARPEQMHFFGNFREEMDEANNLQEFLALSNREYGAEIIELAQAAIDSYVG
jgi:cellulose biosynthesis protein BcsQ